MGQMCVTQSYITSKYLDDGFILGVKKSINLVATILCVLGNSKTYYV